MERGREDSCTKARRDKLEFSSALEGCLPDLCIDTLNDFDTLKRIAENLIFRIKFVSDLVESSSVRNKEKESEDRKLKEINTQYNKVFDGPSTCNSKANQRLVNCIISAFKFTVHMLNDFFEPKKQPKEITKDLDLFELCSVFLSHACKALSVFAVSACDYHYSQDVIKEGEETAHHLADIFKGPKFKVSYAFLNNLPIILECLATNSLIKSFLKCLLDDSRSSAIVAVFLLKHFSEKENLKKFGQNPTKEVNELLLLLGDTLSSIVLCCEEIKLSHKMCLEDIISNCTDLIPAVENPCGLLRVLHSIFLVLEDKRLYAVNGHLAHVLKTSLREFDIWLNTPVESKTWCMLLKTIITVFNVMIFTPSESLLPFINIFIKTVIFALKENEELAQMGLKILRSLTDAMGFEHINSSILIKDLLNTLHESLSSPSEEINKLAFSTLGKMGGLNRSNFKESPKLLEAVDIGWFLTVGFRNTEFRNSVGFAIPLRKIISEAYENLRSPDVEIVIKQHWCFVVKAILTSYIESVQTSSKRILRDDITAEEEGDKIHCKRQRKEKESEKEPTEDHGLPSKQRSRVVSKDTIISSDDLDSDKESTKKRKNRDDTKTDEGEEGDQKSCKRQRKEKESKKQSPQDHGQKEELLKFLIHNSEALPDSLVNLYSQCPEFHVLKSALMAMLLMENLDLDNKSFVEKLTRTFICKADEEVWDLIILFDAAVDVICLSKDSAEKVDISPLESIVQMAKEHFGDRIVDGVFFKYVIQRLTYLCYNTSWESKLAGCKGILFLMKNFQDWKIEKHHLILQPVIYSMADVKRQVSFGSAHSIEKIGKEIFNELKLDIDRWTQTHNDGRMHDEILKILFERASSQNYLEREQVRRAFDSLLSVSNGVIERKLIPSAVLENVHLYEDFNFCLKLKSLFIPLRDINALIKDNIVFDIAPQVDCTERLKIIRKCCGAMYALLFNSVSKEHFHNVFEIFLEASQSSIPAISEAGMTGLKFISEEKGSLLTQKMIDKWFSAYLDCVSPQKKLKDQDFRKLTVFLKYFQSWSKWDLESALMNYFTKWREEIIIICDANEILCLQRKMKEGSQLIRLINLITLKKPVNFKNIFSIVFRLQTYMIHILKGPLRDPLIQFCKQYPLETVKSIIESMTQKSRSEKYFMFLEEIVKMEDSIFCVANLLKEDKTEKYLIKNYDYSLEVLYYMAKYAGKWFENKPVLKDFLLQKWSEKLSVHGSTLKNCYYSKEMAIISECLLSYYKYHTNDLDVLFKLMEVFSFSFAYNFQFLKDFVVGIAKNSERKLKAGAFSKFQSLFHLKKRHVAEIVLQFFIIPSFYESLSKDGQELLNTYLDKESVLEMYLKFLKELNSQELSLNSEKLILMFLKLTLVLAPITVKIPDTSFIEESRKFAESCQNYKKCKPYSDLLLLVISIKEQNDDTSTDALQRLFESFLEVQLEDQHTFNWVISQIPDITDISQSLKINVNETTVKNIFNVIAIDSERFHFFCNFLKLITKLVDEKEKFATLSVLKQVFLESADEIFIHRKKAVDLIELIIQWGDYVKDLMNHQDAKHLFKIICLADSNLFGESLSKKCISLLEDILRKEHNKELKELSLVSEELTFEWLEKYFEAISDGDKKEGSCEREFMIVGKSFELIIKFFLYLPLCSIESFVELVWKNFQVLLKFESICKSLCKFLSVLLENYPPEKSEPFSSFRELCCKVSSKICLLIISEVELFKTVKEHFPACFDALKKCVIDKNHCDIGKEAHINLTMEVLFFSFKDFEHLIFKQSDVLHSFIGNLSNADNILKAINIVDKCTEALSKNKQCCKSVSAIIEISILLEQIYKKIESHFYNDEKVSNSFFEAMRKLIAISPAPLKNDKVFRINMMKIWYKGFVLPKNYEKFYEIIANKFDNDLFCILNFLCEMNLKWMESFSPIKLFMHMILMMIDTISINSGSSNIRKINDVSGFSSSLAKLCNLDDNLMQYVWIHLFPGVYKFLTASQKKILFNKMKRIIKSLSSKENSSAQFLTDVFINTALKCHLHFAFFVDFKHVHRSYDFKVLCSILFEKKLFSESFFTFRETYLHLLNEVYCHLQEDDLFHYVNEIYGNHLPGTLKAMSCFKNGDIVSAYNSCKKILNGEILNENDAERRFLESHLNKCEIELQKWYHYSIEGHYHDLLENVPVFSNWDTENVLSETSLTLRCNLCNLKPAPTIDPPVFKKEEIPRVVNQCINAWKILPKIRSRLHYSYLQLVQQLTELSEAWNKSEEKFIETRLLKELQATCFERNNQQYLLSDDLSFLRELFQVREVSLNRLKKLEDKDISYLITHKINDYAVELCSVALNFEHQYLRNLSFNSCSSDNIFKCNQMKLMYLLKETEEAKDPGTKKEYLIKALECKDSNFTVHMASEKRKQLDILQLKVLKNLLPVSNRKHLDIFVKYVFINPDASEVWDILSEYHLNSYYQSKNIVDIKQSLYCLLEACKFANYSLSLKLITKILHLLELGEKTSGVAKELKDSGIPVSFWISFLPIIFSLLLHSNRENKMILRETLTKILISIGENYPQQVFFSALLLKGIDYQFTDKGSYDKILNALKQKNPLLISILQEIRRIFEKFKSNYQEVFLYKFKEKLQKVYILVYRNWEKQNIFYSKEILDYLKNDLKSDLILINNLEVSGKCSETDFKLFPDCPRSESSTSKEVIDGLKKHISELGKDLQSVKAEHLKSLHEKVQLLSNLYLEDTHVSLFGQSPHINPVSEISIHKIHPKIGYLTWNDSFAWKILIKGNDGKDYSFLLLGDFCRKETLNTMKLMQFMDFLNLLFNQNVKCTRRFLNTYISRITPMSAYNMLIPHQNALVLYQDIYKMHTRKSREFSAVDIFFDELLNVELREDINKQLLKQIFHSVQSEVSNNILDDWVKKIYSYPLDMYYSFKKEFLKHLSVLIAYEVFFKISARKQLCLMKDSGIVTAVHLEMNLGNPNFNDPEYTVHLLTPNIRYFLGPPRIGEMAEHIRCISSCLKENKEIILQQLQIVKQNYSVKENAKMRDHVTSVMKSLNDLNRRTFDWHKLLKENSESVNPILKQFF